MKSLHHLIAIALTASSFALAQNSPIPTKLLSNPVQPTAFSDDPALSTHRPLVIVTPSQSGESTASIILNNHNTRKPLGPNHHAHIVSNLIAIRIRPLPTNNIPQLHNNRGRDFFFFFFFFFFVCFSHYAHGDENVFDVQSGVCADGVCECCGWAYCSGGFGHGFVSPVFV
ncbi:hypothetical protein HDV57DRAFT_512649 [Trichoderma longibrachiatum]